MALGRRAGVATAAGDAAGSYLKVAAVALGVGVLVQRSLAVFTTVKLLGACYLAWLGWAWVPSASAMCWPRRWRSWRMRRRAARPRAGALGPPGRCADAGLTIGSWNQS